MASDSDALRNPWLWIGFGISLLILVTIATPNLLRSKIAADEASAYARREARRDQLKTVALHDEATRMSYAHSSSTAQERKLARTTILEMSARGPQKSAEQIAQLAEGAGGYVVTSQVSGSQNASGATVTIRVPAAKFDQVRTQIRQLGLRVESENLEAQDVTKQYVDQEARLYNLRAQEQQYLGILRKATTVKDTLEVSNKLNEVRGAIEEKQAEFEALSKQVEMITMNITVRAEADTQVFGLHWRPLYQLKMAAREGLDGIGDYATSMATFVFYLPTILLWLFTILAGAAVGWRILRWAARTFFQPAKSQVPQPAS